MRRRGLLLFGAIVCALLALGAIAMALGAARQPRADAPRSLFAAPVATTSPSANANSYAVVKVVDGDTVDVAMDGKVVRLRLIGIDTPETVDPRKPVQCFGPEASAEAHLLLDGQRVRLAYDSVAGAKDKYGRTLAYVFLPDGTFYNEFMVREGFAHEYDFKGQAYEYRRMFEAAQADAKAHLRGFWSSATCGGDTTKPAATSTSANARSVSRGILPL